jgi:L-lysine exporter family protein LysE/ArgO
MSILSLFIEGFILGLGAALPLGPINLLIMNEALKDYKKAVAIGFGAMSVDVTYLVLIYYGITNYLKEALFLNILSLLGGFFLIYLAFLIFKGRNHHIHRMKISKDTTILSNYVKGYLLTLLNPYTVLFWLSVTTYSTTTQSLGITILGMISAIMLWITIMPYIVYKKRTLIPDKLSSVIAVVSSIIILLFGFSLLFKSFSQSFV